MKISFVIAIFSLIVIVVNTKRCVRRFLPGSSCVTMCDYGTGQWVIWSCYSLKGPPIDPFNLDMDDGDAIDDRDGTGEEALVIDPYKLGIDNLGGTDDAIRNYK